MGWAGRYPEDRQAPVGPTITGLIDLRPGAELDEGIIIEEGVIPGALEVPPPSSLPRPPPSFSGTRTTPRPTAWSERPVRSRASLGAPTTGLFAIR